MSGYIDNYKMDFSPSAAALEYKLKDRALRREHRMKAIRDMAGVLSRAAVVAQIEANGGLSEVGETTAMPTTLGKDIYEAHNLAQANMKGYRPISSVESALAGYGTYMDRG